MKPLQAHFLQLTVDCLNPRAMSANQRCVFSRVAGHIPTLFGNEPHATMDVAQLLVTVADIPFVGHHDTTFRQWMEQRLDQSQFIPLGGQQLKGDGHAPRITDQMQLPAEIGVAFAGTIALVVSPWTLRQRSARTRLHTGRGRVSITNTCARLLSDSPCCWRRDTPAKSPLVLLAEATFP